MLDGSREFCQVFFSDVRLPDAERVSQVDDGWTVGIRWMFYERSAGISFHVTRLLMRQPMQNRWGSRWGGSRNGRDIPTIPW